MGNKTAEKILEEARSNGKPDPYIGRRRWTRYHIGMSFEVTVDPSVSGASWRVITHNISGGGLGFWSKHASSPGNELYVRECSEDGMAEWQKAHVRYCVLSVHGYLVGLSFDEPTSPDAAFNPDHILSHQETEDNRPQTSSRSSRILLLHKCIYACAVSSVMVLGGFIIFDHHMPWREEWVWAWVGVLLSAIILASVIGWILMRRETRLLKRLAHSIEHLASNTPYAIPLARSSVCEIDAIHRGILNLGLRWKQHMDTEYSHRERLEEINQIKTNMLSTVSHDLKTPLTSIKLYADMLQEDLRTIEEETQQHFLEIISQESMRLSRLVDDLLEVQRLEVGEVEWRMDSHDLSETIFSVAGTFASVASHHGIDFKVECPELLPKIESNTDKISQVINNLLSNALKFTPRGGMIRLVVEVHYTDILIRVCDNGIGIPREKWDVIFDRFSRLISALDQPVAGTGLGLYIVRQIVEAHGGAVWVDSELGKGSEFCVSLPLNRAKDKPKLPGDDRITSGSVVICEVDPALAASMARTIRNEGYEVRLAHSANRLIEHLSQDVPDLVVTDIALPDMTVMDLFSALNNIKDQPYALVVHSLEGDYSELKRWGVDFLVRRPASTKQFVQVVNIAMHKKNDGREVVMLVDGWGIDCDQLSQHMALLNCIPLTVRDAKEAIEYLASLSIDLIVIRDSAGGYLANDIQLLQDTANNNTHIVVLGESLSGSESTSCSNENITYLPYCRGQEKEAATAIVMAYRTHMQESVR